MKLALKIISIILILVGAFLAFPSFGRLVEFNFMGQNALNADLAFVLLVFFAIGLFAGVTWMGSYFFVAENKIKEYKRKLEKTSVNADSSDSKVAVLESKIEVLERALQSALDKNNK